MHASTQSWLKNSACPPQEMVADLRQQGYKVLIITNGHAEIQRGKLERLHAVDLFDAILVGGEEIAAGRAEKPAASIFLKACQLAECTPDQVAHPCFLNHCSAWAALSMGRAQQLHPLALLHAPFFQPTLCPVCASARSVFISCASAAACCML